MEVGMPPPQSDADLVDECPLANPPPCMVSVISYAEPIVVGWRLCCPQPGFGLVDLFVTSESGRPWGEITEFAFCGWPLTAEFTDSQRGGTVPWAVLDTWSESIDGVPPIVSQCRSSGAPPQ